MNNEPTNTTATEPINFDTMTRDELIKYCLTHNLAKGKDLHDGKKSDILALCKGEILQLPKVIISSTTATKTEPPTTTPTPAPAATATPVTAPNVKDPMSVLTALGQLMGASTINEEGVKTICEAYLNSDAGRELIKKNATIKKVNVSVNSAPAVEIKGKTHKMFERVLKLAMTGEPILLVGGAGTGKTFLARQVAEALKRPFTYNSMSSDVSVSHLVGSVLPQKDGTFEFKKSGFTQTYEGGGVHLFDEVDAADANVMTYLNAALANGHLSIRGGEIIVEKHPDTVIICAANTYGTGASRQYCGRNQLDGATLDRFSCSTIEIDYDVELERTICEQLSGDTHIADLCHAIRGIINENHMCRIMSTRTIIKMCKNLSVGISIKDSLDSYFLPWTKEEKAKCMETLKSLMK